jgi:transcription elongation factor Elf1
MRTLPYQCPGCQRKLAPVAGMRVATQVVQRTCRGCGARWQIVIAPVQRQSAWYDVGVFVRLKNKSEKKLDAF